MALWDRYERRVLNYFKRDVLPYGWFSIRYDHIEDKRLRRRAHGRWVKIESLQGCIYRVPRFSANLEKNVILLDREGWLILNGRHETVEEWLPLKITPLTWYQSWYLFPFIAHSYPEPGYRLATNIALVLGALSLVLGALPLFDIKFQF